MSQIVGILTYIFLFIAYTILVSHPRATKEEKVFYSIIFGVGLLAPTSVIW